MHKVKQKSILIITDGIGYKPDSKYNAFTHANKPTYDWLFENVPYSMVHTYGEFVGLPDGQMGNSEVGHATLGSGRVLYQDLVKINQAISKGELESHPIIHDLAKQCTHIHLIALASDGGVHSHINHLIALSHICHKLGCRVWIHAITDGRDVPPKTAEAFITRLQQEAQGTIATISGRFYALDRDKRWERVLEAYNSIALGKNPTPSTPTQYIQEQLTQGISDEFIKPACFNGYEGFKPNDGIIIVNFRSDRAREITAILGDKAFKECERQAFTPLPLVTMTCYDERFTYPILFPKQPIQNTLAEIFATHSLTQLHTAETEKYAHVTFFFNGGVEQEYPNERRILIPSPQVATYDLQPEMSAKEVANVVIDGMNEGVDVIIVNFANGDMVGHTGHMDAAIKAVEAVDEQLGRIFTHAQSLGYAIILTSDHGNCEEMADSLGNPLTNHTVGDVWCFVMAEGVKQLKGGSLANIAPTLLEVMGLPIPSEMEKSLICAS